MRLGLIVSAIVLVASSLLLLAGYLIDSNEERLEQDQDRRHTS
jgi:hypothetical protein